MTCGVGRLCPARQWARNSMTADEGHYIVINGSGRSYGRFGPLGPPPSWHSPETISTSHPCFELPHEPRKFNQLSSGGQLSSRNNNKTTSMKTKEEINKAREFPPESLTTVSGLLERLLPRNDNQIVPRLPGYSGVRIVDQQRQ